MVKRQNRTRRQLNHTRMMVGEGEVEQAFINHLKSLYSGRNRGLTVKVKSAKGGSPESIVEYTIKQTTTASFDTLIILMDTDKPWTDKLKSLARKHRPTIHLLASDPCIEGLLFEILGQRKPHSPDACKKQMQERLGAVGSQAQDFTRLFTLEHLEHRRKTHAVLDQLIRWVSDPDMK